MLKTEESLKEPISLNCRYTGAHIVYTLAWRSLSAHLSLHPNLKCTFNLWFDSSIITIIRIEHHSQNEINTTERSSMSDTTANFTNPSKYILFKLYDNWYVYLFIRVGSPSSTEYKWWSGQYNIESASVRTNLYANIATILMCRKV